MAIILNIETATENAGVCLSENEEVLAYAESNEQRNHASFIQTAIQEICKNANLKLSEIDAVAVSNGPGSYTGLRVSLATAKGICYAINKPLITLNTLDIMARVGFIDFSSKKHDQTEMPFLICPVIDARRMEVYTALYNREFKKIIQPEAMVITQNSFSDFRNENLIVFLGSGNLKIKQNFPHDNYRFSDALISAKSMIPIALTAFKENQFADLAYCEPFYVKEFYSLTK